MYFLNTTRHLATPPSDATVAHLLSVLEEKIVPSAASLAGIRSISWMLSHDGRTLQAFSGWASHEQVLEAEQSPQHVTNGAAINDLLGGLASPQEHSYYRLLGEHRF
jgi:hypothetical protein